MLMFRFVREMPVQRLLRTGALAGVLGFTALGVIDLLWGQCIAVDCTKQGAEPFGGAFTALLAYLASRAVPTER